MMISEKPILNIGLIGTGFMGKTHVFGFATADRVFDMPFKINLHSVADQSIELAETAASALGFQKATDDWHNLVSDPVIDVIDITAPNSFHKDMAIEAIKAGKHVYCEKPLAPSSQDAEEMVMAAKSAGITTQVGFNYLCNPMMSLARQMINQGSLGEILSYRGIHAEDYMVNFEEIFSWRHEEEGGGVLADLGSHALATAEYLLGPITSVFGDCITVIKERKDISGDLVPIKVDDISRCFVKFSNGVSGSIEANWLATGCKMKHDFEIYGTEGALSFSQERFNELWFYSKADENGKRGFKRIEAGPEHYPYNRFCVAPGHQLGFNDLKAIEINGFVEAIAKRSPGIFSFEKGLHIQNLVELVRHSSNLKSWLTL